jgi:O-antigen ligase
VTTAIAFTLIFILPFIVFPLGSNPYEPIKVIIFQLLTGILTFLVFSSGKKEQKPVHPIFLVVLYGIALLSFFHVVFQRTDVMLFGNAFRMHGVFLLWMLLLFTYFSARYVLPKMHVYFYIMLVMLHLAAGVVMQLTVAGRAVGTVGEPNSFAAVLVFIWPFIWFVQQKGKSILLLQVIATLVVLLTILFTGSRSGLIAFMVQGCFLMLTYRFSQYLGKILIGALIVYCLSLLLPFIGPQTEYENRGEIWQAAVIAGYDNPILGSGFGNTEVVLKESNQKLYNRLRGYYVDSSHNIFLDWWIQGGFLGLSCLIGLFYMAFRVFIKKKSIRELALLLGLLVVFSFNPLSVASLVHLWWLIGRGAVTSE